MMDGDPGLRLYAQSQLRELSSSRLAPEGDPHWNRTFPTGYYGSVQILRLTPLAASATDRLPLALADGGRYQTFLDCRVS